MAKPNLSVDDIRDVPAGNWLDWTLAKALKLPSGRPYSSDLNTCFVALKSAEAFFASTGIKQDETSRAREKGAFFLHGPHNNPDWVAGWMERDSEYPLLEMDGVTPSLAICRAILFGLSNLDVLL
jgi:hypothetical protein